VLACMHVLCVCESVHVRACMPVCVRACVRARTDACTRALQSHVCARVRACVCACACARATVPPAFTQWGSPAPSRSARSSGNSSVTPVGSGVSGPSGSCWHSTVNAASACARVCGTPKAGSSLSTPAWTAAATIASRDCAVLAIAVDGAAQPTILSFRVSQSPTALLLPSSSSSPLPHGRART